MTISQPLSGDTQIDSRGSPKIMLRVSKLWGRQDSNLAEQIIFHLARPRWSGRRIAQRRSSSQSPYKTGAGTCCSPTTHCCTIARAFPPSQAIAEENIASTVDFHWRASERAAILALFGRYCWCEGASAHAGFPARGVCCNALANSCGVCLQMEG
jgi:hypothetical protein